MDLAKVLSALSSSEVSDVSKKTGASKSDITSVITAALPLIANGEDKKTASGKVAKKTGLDLSKVTEILTLLLPVITSLVSTNDEKPSSGKGKKKPASQSSQGSGLLGGLLGNSDLLGTIGGLLDTSAEEEEEEKPKPKKKTSSSTSGKKKTSTSSTGAKKKTTTSSSSAKKKTTSSSSSSKKKTSSSSTGKKKTSSK